MIFLTILQNLAGKWDKKSYEGKDAGEALGKMRADLTAMRDSDLEGAMVEQGFKETRTIIRKGGEWDIATDWAININDNGCGEIEEHPTREAVIDRFLAICAESGEQWDL